MISGARAEPPARRSWWAIGSLVSAGLVFTGVRFAGGPIAVALGWRALRHSGGLSRTSRTLAIVGVVVGTIETVFLAVFVIAALLLYIGIVRVS